MTPPKDSKELRELIRQFIFDYHMNTTHMPNDDDLDVSTDAIMQLIDSYAKEFGRRERLDELKGVKSCFSDLQDAEEAAYIETNYVDYRIAQLSQTVSKEET